MPGYQTKQESVAIAGVADLAMCSLLDRQQFADAQGEALRLGISSAAWPLFGLLWPSGVRLAERLAQRPVRVGERILEVGCGLGLASLVAHRRGADITASDGHPLAGHFLKTNLLLNALAPMKYRHGPWRETAAQLSPLYELVSGRFDLLIGADLLYEPDARGDLAAYIERHAERHAEVWIVDPERGNRAAFNRRMAAFGFARHEERLDRPAQAAVPAYKGRLLVFTRAPARPAA